MWFIVDLALNFRTEVEVVVDDEEDGDNEKILLIRDPHTLAVHYLQRDFWLDLLFSFPWLALSSLFLAPKQKKTNAVRRALGHVGRGVGGFFGKVKNGVGDKIPRALRPGNIRRFLEWTHVLEVKRVEGVKHMVKHRKTYRGLRLCVRGLRWACRFPVVSFVWRVYRKLETHLVLALEEEGEEDALGGKAPAKLWRARHSRRSSVSLSPSLLLLAEEEEGEGEEEEENASFHDGQEGGAWWAEQQETEEEAAEMERLRREMLMRPRSRQQQQQQQQGVNGVGTAGV